ncbi:hypothetical protein JCM10207_003834 [Rhodosporidiobolus poonsookiae]
MASEIPVKVGHKLYILFSISQTALDAFHKPELDSLAKLLNLDIGYPEEYDPSRPYHLISLPNDEQARRLGSRLVAGKHIWEFWARADTYDELHEQVRQVECREKWEPFAEDKECTWKFVVAAHNRTLALPAQIKVINSFAYMPFLGNIDLKKPKVQIGVFEDYEFDRMRGQKVREARAELGASKGKQPRRDDDDELAVADTGGLISVWMGRKICDTQRHLIDVFDLKKRAYIGTTSMEAEVSLLMANQALAGPGKWVYDPFTGTGSMLLTAAGFGAMTFGSDIDGRQMRGKKTSIQHSAKQYGVTNRLVDCYAFDMTQHPWRTGEIFDAIITDPPYGVRAGAKRLGRPEGEKEMLPMVVPGRESEGLHHQFHDYVPPSVGWPMEEVISTLVTFALYLLKPGGRLVFFLPTDNAEYADIDIPSVPGLTLVANSSQSFGKWARRLITMEKDKEGDAWQKALDGLDRGVRRKGQKSAWELEQEKEGAEREEAEKKRPGHADFRERYYEGFAAVKEGVKKLLVGEQEGERQPGAREEPTQQ